MGKRKEVLDAILKQGMLPLFFHTDVQESIAIVKTLYASGIRVFEFTNRGDEAKRVFKALIDARNEEMPDLQLGIGTIKTNTEAEKFISLGADFIVAPIVTPEVGDLTHSHDLLWIPGCMTPTEIAFAQQNKASLIKLFPANVLGPGFVSAIKELFKGQLFIPTGGVDLEIENLKSWFNAGVCAVGMGSKLINPNNTEGLAEKTQQALQLVEQAKASIDK
ncbi:bifunctional 4-hydroxy-2-oxoglutarate aldolase/2-dehydro-3-deoxy-phosphogluconate aldolase [Sphingobacterium gobiense]|uniref:Bifunctional 4-hydroxy-2-oxoglutarate aldolase/2-dehydro-3-deoxy-phosphogluconate aldolase n=1 Tax=Sphingobacterium gobiense TaxID=1382456 RepID=A0A2S9JKP3_9SPHI|nr:bifunctional 4-hydroxy-2-oxoglutarate aldolase/2-dehydro-3-deoxy-phosphogluconate aldolase [Sphingobacterium gobiense]PRD53723.1 bifunctional 4-hydroxy-2-oxoglutarate aldolase/2-dehydro-3-deoxy-phosphogluconate aldolase [Sphingobacterium gobiense]